MKIKIESGQVARLPGGRTTHPDGGTYTVDDDVGAELIERDGITEVKPKKRTKKKTKATTSSD